MKFTITEEKHPLFDAYRIIAAESSNQHHVSAGDFGGFLSDKKNLDENSEAWVADDSIILGDSVITGSTLVTNKAVLTDVHIGLDSYVSGVSISNMTFGNAVRIYGDDISMAITDRALAYRTITANKYIQQSNLAYIGYARFIGTLQEFQDYVNHGGLPDKETDIINLVHQYITIIDHHLFQNK